MKFAITCAAALAFSACMQAPAGGQDSAEGLMQTSRAWSKAAEAGDLDAVASYFAEDAVMLSAGDQPIRGKQAIRASLAEVYKIPGFKISWEPLEGKVSGDMGYLLERTNMTMNGPEGTPVSQTLQAVTIWRKQADGDWKNVVDVGVPAPGGSAATG